MVNLITEHIDIWAAAQTQQTNGGRGRGKNSNGQCLHGIKKLRELILDLAVRGKLVPQDPKDEPASVLLEKIAKEKAQLIKEAKIKRQKKLPEISEDEKPFNLPESWEWVRLGDVGNIFNGNSISAQIKKYKYTDIDGGLPFIATKDVGYGWDRLSYNNGVSIPLGEPKFKVAHREAVLICSEGGSAGKKCGITDQDICFGNKLFANELYGKIESDFILANYLSPTFFCDFSEKMTGIIGGISAAKFSQLLVPIPPLSEQHRIVAKVDELMTFCDQLEHQQTDSNASHKTLVETLLATITNTANQREFAKAWQRIANHFDTLFTTEHSIDQLKQTILQLAVMGKLVPQDPMDLPAPVRASHTDGPKPGKFFVYALECEDKSIYVGQTSDILKRWKEHAAGKGADWTKKHPPIRLVHWEEYDSREEAIKREKELKTESGRKWIKRELAAGRTRQAGESASILLEKIAKEKSRLIKEGKIKKQKPLVDFQGLEELKGQLPVHWVWARLADVADIVRGGSPRPAGDPRYYDGEIPFLKVADISNVKGKMVEGFNFTIKKAGLKKTRFIDKHTVLLTNSGATLGIPAICDFATTFNDGIAAFVELSKFVFDEYLYLYLKTLSKWFLEIASRGQGQPNLNTDIIKATWFALPPIDEQHRIVAKVDELMALCDTLKVRLNDAQTAQIQLADAIVEQAVA